MLRIANEGSCDGRDGFYRFRSRASAPRRRRRPARPRAPGSDRRNIAGWTSRVIEGDLADDAVLARALEGCDALFHVAADYRLWARRPNEIYQTNVEGTRAMSEGGGGGRRHPHRLHEQRGDAGAARRRRAGRRDEAGRFEGIIGHYKRSKFMAEEVVREFVDKGLAVVTVNPSAPVGPRDVKPTPTGRMILEAAAGRMPAYVETGLNIVHVDDVADGHWLAFERGRVGETYVLRRKHDAVRDPDVYRRTRRSRAAQAPAALSARPPHRASFGSGGALTASLPSPPSKA